MFQNRTLLIAVRADLKKKKHQNRKSMLIFETEIHSVAQAGFELDPPPSVSQMLGIQGIHQHT